MLYRGNSIEGSNPSLSAFNRPQGRFFIGLKLSRLAGYISDVRPDVVLECSLSSMARPELKTLIPQPAKTSIKLPCCPTRMRPPAGE